MFKTTKIIGLVSLTACFFSAGIVAPVLSQSQESQTRQEYPTQIATYGSSTWELKSCARKKNHVVSCMFQVSGSETLENYRVSSAQDTKLVDNEGDEYYVGRLATKTKIAGPNSEVRFNLYKDARYKVTIDFSGVPDSVLYAPSLRIKPIYWANTNGIAFEDVPFINSDGTISEVPLPVRPHPSKNPSDPGSVRNDNPAPGNTAPTMPSATICVPFMGCVRR